jgi:hypothetical protein
VNKLRWGKFYWSDWSDDPALAMCSLAAQGLWMRLLCLAAQGSPYGYVIVNGKPPTVEHIARLVRASSRDVARLIEQLERNGVATRDASGCLLSRRMVHDGRVSAARAAAAGRRWDGGTPEVPERYDGGAPEVPERYDGSQDASRDNATPTGFLHMQTDSFASIELDAKFEQETEVSVPLTPSLDAKGEHPAAGAAGTPQHTHAGNKISPRQKGTNPRAVGTNPRATNPKAKPNGPATDRQTQTYYAVQEVLAARQRSRRNGGGES